MDALFVYLGMMFIAAVATWSIIKSITTPKQPPMSDLEREVRRKWEEYQKSKKSITLNEEAAGND
jgi:hypothetical protein